MTSYYDLYERIRDWKDSGKIHTERKPNVLIKEIIGEDDFLRMVVKIRMGEYDWILSSNGLTLFRVALIRARLKNGI